MKKTTIDHRVRRRLSITCDQYVFLEFLMSIQNPRPKLQDFKDNIWFDEETVKNTFESLKKSDLIKWNEDGIAVTEIWLAYFDNSALIRDIIDYFNRRTNSGLTALQSNTKEIKARLKEASYTLDDFKLVIDLKTKEWTGTDQEQYIRPATLFGGKFSSYLEFAKKTIIKDEPTKMVM